MYIIKQHLKSIHFKNKVPQSSFHSKIWSFSIIHHLTLFRFSWSIIETDHIFEWNEDRTTVFLKWTDFRYIYAFYKTKDFENFTQQKQNIYLSPAGFEPATFGLEVQRAIHCATGTGWKKVLILNFEWIFWNTLRYGDCL